MKAYIETLGCKVNFSDSAKLTSLLISNGYTITSEPFNADIFIINSCSVTHKAERECRQLARRFYQINPNAMVIITGCSVFSPSFKNRANEVPFAKMIRLEDIGYTLKLSTQKNPVCYYNRSRPFIKIQEGCDRFCSYCLVPMLRGKPRSKDKNEIIRQIRDALENGFQEIVLVGTHIMLYKDPLTDCSIFDLLDNIEKLNGNFRIRLSSMEPYELTLENIKRLSEYKRLCGHFHIPLQSGSDKILKVMKRGYTTAIYKSIIEEIKKRIPDVTIGTDIITGFPTETEEDFKDTIEFIQSSPIDYLHVFTFSPREGTPAASIKPTLRQSEIKIHSQKLIKISFDKRKEMVKKFLGREMDVVITSDTNPISGLTHNYIKVVFKNGNPTKSRIYPARLLSLNTDNTIIGEFL